MAAYFYVEKDTAIHRMNPISKMLCLVLWFAMALIFSRPIPLLALGLIAVLIGCYARALRNVLTVYKLMIVLFLFSAIMWILFYRGNTVLLRTGIGRWCIWKEGVVFGVAMGIRLNLMLFCGLVFLAATKVEEFTVGLNRLGLPYPVSFAFSLAFRLVPMFMESAQTIMQAQQCRGLDLESGGPIRRTRNYIPLIVPVFMTAVRSVDGLAMALESKGFGAKRARTSYAPFSFGLRDAIAVVVCVALLVLCVMFRLKGNGI